MTETPNTRSWRTGFSGSLVDLVLVAFALVGALVLGATTTLPTTAELESRQAHVLPRLSLDDLRKVTITVRGRDQQLVLRRADTTDRDAYYLGTSGSDLAQPARVHELLAALDFARFERKWDAPEDPPEASSGEVTAPLVVVQIESEGGNSELVVLEKSASSQADTPRYRVRVRRGNSAPVLGIVSGRLVEELRTTPEALYGDELFMLGIDETQSLVFRERDQDTPLLHLVADDLGFLLRAAPAAGVDEPVRAGRTPSDLIFFHLGRARLEQFLPVEEVAQRLKTASDFIAIEQRGPGLSVVVQLGGRCPGDDGSFLAHRLRPRPIAGCVSGSIAPLLNPQTMRWPDPTATLLTPDEMDHVELRVGAERIDVMRDGAGFVALHRDREPVDPGAARDWFTALSEGALLPLAPPSPLPGEPRGELTISGVAPGKALPPSVDTVGTDENEEREFATRQSLLLHGAADATVIHRLDDGTWWAVPPELTWAYGTDDAWARDRQLTSFDPEQVTSLRLSVDQPSATGSTTLPLSFDAVIERGDEGFVLENAPIDSRSVRRLLDELAHLEALRFEVGAPSLTASPRLRVRWSLVSGEEQELVVGQRVRGGFLAQLDQLPGSFVLAVPTVTRLMLPLGDRSPAQLSWNDESAWTFEFDGRTSGFERVTGRWRTQGAATTEQLEMIRAQLDQWEVVARLPREPKNAVPLLSIRAGRKEGQRSLDVLRRARAFGSDLYEVRVAGEPGTFLVQAAGVEALFEVL